MLLLQCPVISQFNVNAVTWLLSQYTSILLALSHDFSVHQQHCWCCHMTPLSTTMTPSSLLVPSHDSSVYGMTPSAMLVLPQCTIAPLLTSQQIDKSGKPLTKYNIRFRTITLSWLATCTIDLGPANQQYTFNAVLHDSSVHCWWFAVEPTAELSSVMQRHWQKCYKETPNNTIQKCNHTLPNSLLQPNSYGS